MTIPENRLSTNEALHQIWEYMMGLERRLIQLELANKIITNGWAVEHERRLEALEAKASMYTDPGIIGRNEWRRDKRIAELEKTIEDAQLELRDLRND